MPLVPPVTPLEVETLGALTPNLFQLTLQADLDAIVQSAIDYADAWMQGHMGSNYGLTDEAWQVTLQRRGQMYLSLESLCDTIKAEKIYGKHYPFMSEESASYEALIENEWGQRAIQSLDLWVTVEQLNKAFHLPIFSTSAALIENSIENPAIETLSLQYAKILDRARGIVNPDIGTVRR